ncbi:hypothetical protein [Thiovibrio frasassiensis]|jgi:hypothetical protein|uniref:Uncharacterized protein n=1 Tax=Thiovibrio frasassiensis TaxID=2984131 RepID=A0A9X4MEC6_9BACT|nr:hypothetical protein [Thiovibrio frasassiensis]MDG4474761.1 hypothetical protein [Thiovibrio frasassiensis]
MSWLFRLKPGASIRTNLLVAALMWSFIGLYLIVRGYLLHVLLPGIFWALALGLGTLKARFVIERAARKNITRIVARPDGMCLGGVYSWGMWGMVVCMMLAGRLLRNSAVPSLVVSVIYVAVGWALLLSSRLIWQEWNARRTLR